MASKKLAPVPTKEVQIEFKAANDGGQTVTIEGFANKSVVDRGGDLIPPEAWQLDNFKRNPVIFFNHDRNMPIGKATNVEITKEGLRLTAQISSSKEAPIPFIRDMIREGILKTFSVGFDPKDSEEKDKDGVNVIKQAELLETSVVTLPMNQESFFEVTSKMLKKCKTYDAAKALITKSKAEDEPEEESEEEPEEELDTAAKLMAFVEQARKAGEPIDWNEAIKLIQDEEEPKEEDEEEPKEEEPKEEEPEEEEPEEEEPKEDEEESEEEPEEEQKSRITGETGAGNGQRDHKHDALWDNESGAGQTTKLIGDGPDHKHEIKDYKVLMGGDDDHIHELANANKKSAKDAFQDCVAQKIPVLIEEGMERDQAIARAIAHCNETKGTYCPSKEDYKLFLDVADGKTKAEDENGTGLDAEVDETEFGNPHLTIGKAQLAMSGTMVTLLKELIDETRNLNGLIAQTLAKEEQSSDILEEDEDKEEDDDEISDPDSKSFNRSSSIMGDFEQRMSKVWSSVGHRQQSGGKS